MSTATTTPNALAPLPEFPTKAQELDYWRTFLNALPPTSYLGLYLAGSAEFLEHEMRNDASTELLPAIRAGRYRALEDERDAVTARDKARGERDRMTAEVKDLARETARLRDELADIHRACQTLAVRATEAHATAVHTAVDQAIRGRR